MLHFRSADHQMKSATHVAIAIPSASSDTAGARAFLQERLALWALWVFILSGGFFLVNVATWPFLRGESGRLLDTLRQPGNLFHIAASTAFGVDWLIARHARLSVAGLRILDAAALIGGCLLFSL